MDERVLDELLGPRLEWNGAQTPAREPLTGRYVTLEPLDVDLHGHALFTAQARPDADPLTWVYMGNGPFPDEADFRAAYLEPFAASSDPLAYAVIPTGGDAAGILTYMRIAPNDGTIEIGHIWYGAGIQRSPATTEVVYLTAKHAFEDLGYRRFEWKCHARNARSRRAALRFGFSYEGTFRNALVMRGRNRDTAWYAMTDDDWPRIKQAFEAWLDPTNFDDDGGQRERLEDIRDRLP